MSFLYGVLLSSLAVAETVADAFPPPEGAERIEGGEFGRYLGALELRGPEVPVRTHAGVPVRHKARVIDLPLVDGDLQQCADSVIRVHAEWRLSMGEKEISYHATSGDPLPWDRYQSGERPYVKDNRISWRSSGTEGSWEGWLGSVFMWAGTLSLEAYETTPVTEPQPGDVLVEGGSPGHAVLILDVARRGSETWLLVGEGFMPAQDFHVELGPEDGWWLWTDDGLRLPYWNMGSDSLRRWR